MFMYYTLRAHTAFGMFDASPGRLTVLTVCLPAQRVAAAVCEWRCVVCKSVHVHSLSLCARWRLVFLEGCGGVQIRCGNIYLHTYKNCVHVHISVFPDSSGWSMAGVPEMKPLRARCEGFSGEGESDADGQSSAGNFDGIIH